ncbi:hypothetical protein ACHAWF_013963 [Thalassiosira exigua]
MYKSCHGWFPVNAMDPNDYAGAKLFDYLWVLFGICVGQRLVRAHRQQPISIGMFKQQACTV